MVLSPKVISSSGMRSGPCPTATPDPEMPLADNSEILELKHVKQGVPYLWGQVRLQN